MKGVYRDIALELLRECRDFIDHGPHHDHPYQPEAPCCVLERRIDDFLEDLERTRPDA